MGDDTIYSGTVAAATEGFLLGIPSLAVSLANVSAENFSTATLVTVDIVQRFKKNNFHEPILLNINVPDIPYDDLQGIEVTRLGRRHKAEAVVKSRSPRGETVYWVGAAGAVQDASENTDFYAIQQNRVSLTPLQIDLTQYGQIETVKQWLK
jgi:5'-nucleotidase